MNVFAASSGSWSKARAACWAATKALVVLIVMSRVKSSIEIEKGLSAALKVAAAAFEGPYQQPSSFGWENKAINSIADVVHVKTGLLWGIWSFARPWPKIMQWKVD